MKDVLLGMSAPAVVPSAEALPAALVNRSSADRGTGGGMGGSEAVGGRGVGGSGGGGGGAAATPAQGGVSAPGSAEAGPGPGTTGAACTLAQLHAPCGPGDAAAAGLPRQSKRTRFGEACHVCKAPVDRIHKCLACGSYVHTAACSHILVENYGEPVLCFGCLAEGATDAEVAAAALGAAQLTAAMDVAPAEEPPQRQRSQRNAH